MSQHVDSVYIVQCGLTVDAKGTPVHRFAILYQLDARWTRLVLRLLRILN